MKGFTLGFLLALYAPAAVYAAGGVSRIIPGTDKTTTPTVNPELRTNGDVASRTSTNATRTTGAATRESNDTGRVATTRNIVRNVSAETSAGTQTRVANRSTDMTRVANSSDTSRANLNAMMHTGGRSTRTEAASINANPAVRRAGLTLRPSTAEVGGRAIMADGSQTGSNISSEISNLKKSSRIATVKRQDDVKLDPAAIAEAKDRMEQTAALNKSCQEQYNDCMDQFCSVIDANQKRCSCSSNLAKYAKVEQAVKDANNQLNEVAQNIRYVGLSADEISAIMSATEAEEAMTTAVDTTESRSMLDDIAKMIKDPTSTSSASFSSDSYGLLDIDLDFSNTDSSDLFSLDFFNNSNTGFSSLRGSDLYNAAKKRCNTIITQCKEVGATAQQITGNYDLAIDKDCIAYEQGLTKMNETLVANVRSATRMLQKARLAVLQNQNTYNARECIAALETCMTDEMVCGENYTKCLDPTKMYIDENGNVVLGKNINVIQNFMENYNNASINTSFLSSAYGATINETNCSVNEERAENTGDGKCVVKYLLGKIGTKQKATDEGLCRPVLDKCQAYTYDSRGNYNAYNDIVVNYIQRAMVNIKAAQYQIVSDYASTCLNDIAECYNEQVSQVTSWSSTASASSVYNIMRGACRNLALTCGYAVFAADNSSCPTDNPEKCIESISEIFYQSLLCPDNSFYVSTPGSVAPNNTWGHVNAMCVCNAGYWVFAGRCVPVCESGGYNTSGICDATLACPAHSSSEGVNGNDGEFWGGQCNCNNDDNYYLFNSTCLRCPEHSVGVHQDSETEGDVYDGRCQCDAADKYVSTHNGTQCELCPGGAQYNPASNGNLSYCNCPVGKTWDRNSNKCINALVINTTVVNQPIIGSEQ
ncbi:MAG: hypothetical protein J6T57_03305 [Alphaproteobacteria bacterium]|nr:hypothetical protein [Alphaproteobacteria bacterium]